MWGKKQLTSTAETVEVHFFHVHFFHFSSFFSGAITHLQTKIQHMQYNYITCLHFTMGSCFLRYMKQLPLDSQIKVEVLTLPPEAIFSWAIELDFFI